jgi:hypothetical protein
VFAAPNCASVAIATAAYQPFDVGGIVLVLLAVPLEIMSAVAGVAASHQCRAFSEKLMPAGFPADTAKRPQAALRAVSFKHCVVWFKTLHTYSKSAGTGRHAAAGAAQCGRRSIIKQQCTMFKASMALPSLASCN